ncbi:hypothetical protein Q7P37_009306 [Cladosporium fusiforme]
MTPERSTHLSLLRLRTPNTLSASTAASNPIIIIIIIIFDIETACPIPSWTSLLPSVLQSGELALFTWLSGSFAITSTPPGAGLQLTETALPIPVTCYPAA